MNTTKISSLEKKLNKIEKQYEQCSRKIEDLSRQLKQYKSIFNASDDGILIHDHDGNILDVNRMAARLLGYNTTELLNRNVSVLVPEVSSREPHPSDQPAVTESGAHYEIELQRKSGETFPAEISSMPFKMNGKSAVQKIIRDISQRRKMELELTRSEKKLQSIMRSVPDIVYQLDEDSNITFMSDSIREYGYEPEELLGQNIFDLIHPKDRERARYHVNERRTGDRRTRSFEFRFLTRDHKYVSWDIHARGIYQEPVFMLDAEGLYNSDIPSADNYLGSLGVARDITGKKLAESALRESERKLNAILSSMVDSVFLFDDNGSLISSHSHNNNFFKDTSDKIGEPFQKLFPRRLHSIFSQALKENRSGKVSEQEFWLKQKGKQSWYSAKFSPTFSDIQYNGSVVVIRDISEQKHTEQALKRKNRQHELLLETARHLTSTLDVTDVLTQIGKGAKTILKAAGCFIYITDGTGKAPSPVIKIHSAEMKKTLKSDIEQQKIHTIRAIRSRKGLIINRPPDTGNNGLSSHLIVVPFITGKKVLGTMCLQRSDSPFSAEDLSLAGTFAAYASAALNNAQTHQELQKEVKERLEAEKSHRESEERYRQFFEEDLTGDYISTAKGELLACNTAFLRIFGFENRKEALQTNVMKLYPNPDDRKALLKLLSKNKKLEYHEMELRRSDGKPVFVIANMAGKFDAGGKLHEIKGYLFDNTEQKVLQQQFRQAQKMEAIGRLAGGVAHDFNNLLTIINGYSELILHRIPKNNPFVKDIKQIKQAGEKASRLTNQLLAFSRRQVMQPKLINLNSVVKDVNKMLYRLIGEDIELVINLQPNLGIIQTDPGQLEQVLMNLAVNARDAMPNGGKLTIETANVTFTRNYVHRHIAVQPAGNYVMLSVSDSGIGMNEETQAHIFEPFFTTKEYGKGTGLGLSTVYGIVKQSGGFIWVTSEMGHGTTFTIYFPEMKGEARDTETAPKHLSKSLEGDETILLVEDEDMVRDMAVRILKEKGFTVLASAKGEEAMTLSQQYQGPIHMMVTDIVMPGISGKKLVQEIKKSRPDLKVLYISGYTDEIISQQGLLDKNIEFLQKPFLPEKLLTTLRNILDKGKGERQDQRLKIKD
jgi:two-component system cell cycle sensor histidine kinase/response regulator CckA